jgi:hypothetical protein
VTTTRVYNRVTYGLSTLRFSRRDFRDAPLPLLILFSFFNAPSNPGLLSAFKEHLPARKLTRA